MCEIALVNRGHPRRVCDISLANRGLTPATLIFGFFFTRVSTCICIRLHHFSNRGESRTVHGCGVVLDWFWCVGSCPRFPVKTNACTHTHTHTQWGCEVIIHDRYIFTSINAHDTLRVIPRQSGEKVKWLYFLHWFLWLTDFILNKNFLKRALNCTIYLWWLTSYFWNVTTNSK